MAIVTGDRYLEKLVKFVDEDAGALIDGSHVLKLNPAGLHYVHSRLEALAELENLLAGAPIDYLRAYVSDLGDHRALEQLRRILRLLTSLKVVSVLPPPSRDPTPLSLLPFGRLRVLELRGCDLSTSAARGLLELRHTLEKIICHNSTDALRHVFASRIAEIKYSPQWNRLSFVSCACNRLLLMDESLQLLPAVEILDLSRNKFAKVDNLRKCTKLKYLDLGFNHLRTIAPFTEVSCQIIKLVLRNNALTTLHGLENLKSLEGLDVSYNIISNFSELEFLSGLPFLQNLWLEGNPLCSARWYRAQVFCYFSQPDKLKLDDKEISTRDFWKRQIIIASRLKSPASYGFYSPAKDGVEGDGSINRKRRKVSRLASIESEEESTCFSSDQESLSCDNEIQSKEENAISDDEAEIVDLINRVELMKKERSVLWLREFKEWMDHESEDYADGDKYGGPTYRHVKDDHLKNNASLRHQGESSRYAFDSLQTSGDETSTNIIESDNSFADIYNGSHVREALAGMMKVIGNNYKNSYSLEDFTSSPFRARSSHPDSFTIKKGQKIIENGSISPLTTIGDTTESLSSSAYPLSPPHYQQDILNRRQNLVEEILQLSAESFSVVSSDSDTSSNEDNVHDIGHLEYEIDQPQNEKYLYTSVGGRLSSNYYQENNDDHGQGIRLLRNNEELLSNSFSKQSSSGPRILNSDSNNFPAVSHDDEMVHSVNQEADQSERRKSKRKMRRRVIALPDSIVDREGTPEKLNDCKDTCKVDVEGSQQNLVVVMEKKQLRNNPIATPTIAHLGELSDEFIEKYFNSKIADSRNNETCRNCMRCDCVLEPGSLYRERQIAILLSSENKLYIMLIGATFDGSGSILSLLAQHKVEDVGEIIVGIGLQYLRVYIEKGATYLFLTRSLEKSRQLLYIFQVYSPCSTICKFLLRSLEQVQVEFFEKQICGGSKLSIFQYSMVLFQENRNEEESWVPRSLFVSGGCVFVCVEDLKQFGSLSVDQSSPPYFSLDCCYAISDISELVIERRESRCITLVLKRATTKLSCLSSEARKGSSTIRKGNTLSDPPPLTWKLKWFSEDGLRNFVALMKAIHAGVTSSNLLITYVS